MPLLRQGHLELVTQDHDQTAFKYLQRGRIHHTLDNLCQWLSHPHSKIAFSEVQREIPVFKFVPVASGPVD